MIDVLNKPNPDAGNNVVTYPFGVGEPPYWLGESPYTPAWPYPNQPWVPTVTTTGTTIYAGPSREEFERLEEKVSNLIERFDALTAPPSDPLRSDDV